MSAVCVDVSFLLLLYFVSVFVHFLTKADLDTL